MGSPTAEKTIGIVGVDALAASADGVPPAAKRTATRSLTSSAASAGNRSYRPSAQRNAIRRFSPSTNLFPQAVAKCFDHALGFVWRTAAEKSDDRDSGLLCDRRSRPRSRAAKRDYEFSPSNVDCHVTLPWGSCNGEDDITPGLCAGGFRLV